MFPLAGKFSRIWRKQSLFLICVSANLAVLQRQSEVLQNDDGRSRETVDSQVNNETQSDPDERTEKLQTAFFEDHEDAAWASLSAKILQANASLSKVHWSSIGDAVANKVIPEWAKLVPGYIAKLQGELELKPSSLAHEILQEARDPYMHPEIAAEPRVRIGKGLCKEELSFVQRRKSFTKSALAKYLELAELDIDIEDIPTIAICGSGGGLRALVAGASSSLSAQRSGLLDCAMYTAGVSGSCWLQTLYNSSLSGCKYEKIIEHLKNRIGTHIAYPPAFLELVTRAPTNKYILSGTIEKLKGDPKADFGLVDIYGVLLATRLMIPKDELSLDDRDLKLSSQRRFLERGQNPMPIYTAVRHEIPLEEAKTQSNATGNASDSVTQEAKRRAWFQWFEMTPYELGCEELQAAIPSWSIGSHYIGGKRRPTGNGFGLPELRMPFLMGIWGSAFCATLAHYYKEVRPLFKQLAGFDDFDDLIEGQKDELARIHPVDPGQIPNYALGLEDLLPPSCPTSIFREPYLNLMDAGMSNNLPIYPLLRKDREIDIIVCFDASADVEQENWLSLVDGYAKQQEVTGWPVGAGWPKKRLDQYLTDATNAMAAEDPASQVANKENERPTAQPQTKLPTKVDRPDDANLGFCNVWVGNTGSKNAGDNLPRLRLGEEWRILESDTGITVVYFPFLPNPKVEGVDPAKSAFLSTWNFVYDPKEIDKVVALAKANYDEGEEQVRRVVRAVYQKKKARRLYSKRQDDIEKSELQLRNLGDFFS